MAATNSQVLNLAMTPGTVTLIVIPPNTGLVTINLESPNGAKRTSSEARVPMTVSTADNSTACKCRVLDRDESAVKRPRGPPEPSDDGSVTEPESDMEIPSGSRSTLHQSSTPKKENIPLYPVNLKSEAVMSTQRATTRRART
ncbi:hypothetical protein OBBRIDRAFT_790065 [Obba rivulosa]|uniref:Uncharacterized protein n=1 Tax=Obba rivulosa TaxID=1052685 RepID=A0A8E2DQA5_9APHY|nr:hypothetical protein OBBRIDRAFT_790065 [Obba rivulosa]